MQSKFIAWLTFAFLSTSTAWLVSSCASANRTNPEETAAEEVSEEGADTAAAEGGGDDLAAAEAPQGAEETGEGDAAKPEGDLALTGDSASSDLTANAEAPKDDFGLGTDSATPTDGLSPDSSKVDMLASPAGDLTPPSDQPKPNDVLAGMESSQPTDIKVEAPVARPRRSSMARLPQIPAEAMNKKGKNLNRFYFLRHGDTAAKVSELLYGTGAMAKELKNWNGKNWSAGTVVYYVSPSRPDDHEMKSFYQERSVPVEEYELVAGETLPSIAKTKFGDRGSWKEIAVTNGVTSPDKLGAGMRLALYPKDLAPFAYNGQEHVAANEPPKNQTPEVTSPDQHMEPPAQPTDPMAQGEHVEEGGEEPTLKKVGGKLDFKKLIEQNLFAVFVIGAIVVLGLLLMVIGRRRKGRGGEEAGEEEFDSPRAKRQ